MNQLTKLKVRLEAALAQNPRRRRGMSLVEVMVVIAIIVTLMSVVGIGAMNAYESSLVEVTKVSMHEVNKQVEMYSLRKKLPSSGEGLDTVYGSQRVPTDGWGKEFSYLSPGPNGLKYDIISYGADGTEGGEDNDADIKYSEMR
jgi:general secretion pathway protein G